MGVAIGVFITFTPTVGIQMILTVFIAWLFRANKLVGLPIVWISNPATVVPIYYGCYWLGRWLLNYPEIGKEWWNQLLEPPSGWWASVVFYWERLWEIAAPLWLGSIVIGLGLAYPSYLLVYFTIRTYRLRRWGQLVPPSATEIVGEEESDE